MAALTLFNSLTRAPEPFNPIHPDDVRVYTCGPTVYNYQHIGNMRAFLFADTLVRTLRWKGYSVRHVINITDVGHLTSDADAGDDKMEAAATREGRSIWDIAAHYTAAFKADVARLNIVAPTLWSVATDHIGDMSPLPRALPRGTATNCPTAFISTCRPSLITAALPALRTTRVKAGSRQSRASATRRISRSGAPHPRASSAKWNGTAPGDAGPPAGTSNARS
jgi:cysteinyl-tRNA synthetase